MDAVEGPSVSARHPAVTLIGAVMVVAGLVVLVATNRADARDAWRAVRGVRGAWLAVAIALAGAWLVNLAALHAAAQRAAGLPTRPRQLTTVVAAANALNLVTKSGGFAGLVPLTADARRRGLARGPVVAAYVLVIVLGEVAFAATLAVAVTVMAVDGHLSRTEVLATAVFAAYVALRLAVVGAALRSRASIRRLHALPRRLVDRLRRRTTDRAPGDGTHEAADELFDAVQLLRTRPAVVVPALVHALLVEAIGVAMLWSVLEALSVREAVAVPFVAYAVSVLFTIVGVLPAGIGLVEVSMGAVLVSFGVVGATAAAAVVLYRVLELWLPAVLGGLAGMHLRRARARGGSAT